MLAGELRLERAHQDVVHERALAAPGDAGDRRDRAEREAEIDALEVVLARAGEHEPLRADAAPRFRDGDLTRAREILPRERAFGDARHRAGEDELAALLTALRPELHH